MDDTFLMQVMDKLREEGHCGVMSPSEVDFAQQASNWGVGVAQVTSQVIAARDEA